MKYNESLIRFIPIWSSTLQLWAFGVQRFSFGHLEFNALALDGNLYKNIIKSITYILKIAIVF
jgi:hypothetical protein